MIWNQLSPRFRSQVLAMNCTPSCASTLGCRELTSSITPASSAPPFAAGVISGRTKGTGADTATSAKLARTSISAQMALAWRNTSEKLAATSTTRSTRCRCCDSYDLSRSTRFPLSPRSFLLVNLVPSFFASSTWYEALSFLRTVVSSFLVSRRYQPCMLLCSSLSTLSACSRKSSAASRNAAWISSSAASFSFCSSPSSAS